MVVRPQFSSSVVPICIEIEGIANNQRHALARIAGCNSAADVDSHMVVFEVL